MLIMSWLWWWYGRGWADTATAWRSRLRRIYLDFSVPLLATTLFAPWRRIVSGGGGSLEQRFRAGVDNLVSRVVGFFVRVLALAAALVLITLGAVFGAALLVAWPFVPVAAVGLILVGIVK